MSRKMLQSVQVAVTLSLNIITRANGDDRLLTFPLVTLTPILFALWQFRDWLMMALIGLVLLTGEVMQVITIIGKILVIGFKSLAWGVGL